MKRLQEQSQKPKKQLMKTIKLTIGGLFLFLVLEVWLVNRLSTYGEKIQQIKLAEVSLSLENQNLENEIAQNSALAIMELRAKNLGFENIKNLQYLKTSGLALAP